MSGLTSRQQWTHDHIARCTCGSWVVLTDAQATRLASHDEHPQCRHVTATAMEAA